MEQDTLLNSTLETTQETQPEVVEVLDENVKKYLDLLIRINKRIKIITNENI